MKKKVVKEVNPATNTGSLLSEKTNQDFNKKKPDPRDPNERRGAKEKLLKNVKNTEGPKESKNVW